MRMNFSSVLKLMKQRYGADGEYLWDLSLIHISEPTRH